MAEEMNEAGLMLALESLHDLERSCNRMENSAEAKMSEAENELMVARKVRGFVKIQLDDARKALMKLREAHK